MTDEHTFFQHFTRQLLAGDREVVAGLAKLVSRYLFHFGARRCGDPENLKAEVMASVMQNLRNDVFRGENLRQFNGYVRKIVRNMVLREMESQAKYEPVSDIDQVEVPGLTPPDHVADSDLVEFVLNRMPLPCREILTLKFIHDLTNSEIAEQLKLREVTVRVRIHRCVEYARQVMKDHDLL